MGRRRPPPRIKANRLNAKKSTGPRTSVGKKRSSQNAILHGFAAQNSGIAYSPEVECFAQMLCAGDDRADVLEAARELAAAQMQLNSIRRYRLILKQLKVDGLLTLMPASTLLEDPIIMDFTGFVLTGEPRELGVPDKKDYKLYNRIINFIYQQARRSKDPEIEGLKLGRYERVALRRRHAAVERFDEARGAIFAEVAPIVWPRPSQPSRLPALRATHSLR